MVSTDSPLRAVLDNPGLDAAALAALGGAVAGALGAVLLARLGVPVRRWWCAVPVAGVCGACGLFDTGSPWWWVAVRVCLGCLGVLLAVADLRARRLPNLLTGAACCVLGVLLLALAPVSGADAAVPGRAALGVAIFGGGHLLVHLLIPGGLGAGDVKLAVALGAVLGVLGVPAMALAGVLAAAVTASLALGARLCGSRCWQDGVPHGPGLLLATWLLAMLPGGVAG